MSGIDPISTIGNLADDIINKIWPDPAQRAQADVVEAQAKIYAYTSEVIQPALAQLEVDKAEGGSSSLFVAGWRPFVGWVCGTALAYTYIIQPLAVFGLAACGEKLVLPTLSLGELMPVLLGMLGLGGLRTIEKVSAGVDANATDAAPQSNRTLGLSWLTKK